MLKLPNQIKNRCFGNKPGQELYARYHDNEWGVPVYNDQQLFEMLILEGAQAGLSWETILKRRENYRQAFHQFDAHKIVTMTDDDLADLKNNPGIIRNRLKINAVRKNAEVFLKIQNEYGTFSNYVWAFVNHKPIKNHWESFKDIPTSTSESITLSKDLIKRGMTFVGPTIMYAFMQAIGMVNDHLTNCSQYET